MKRALKFIAVGSFFSTVEEFLTVVVIRHDVGSYVFTLLILFPCFLLIVLTTSRLIPWFVKDETNQDIVHYFLYGFAGLMIEWFLIGLSPWSNPNANPFLMLIFQLGMFSFWATVAFAPRLFTKSDELSHRTKRAILRFYVPYFLFVYVVAFTVPAQLKFVAIVGLILFGYLFLNGYYCVYFARSFSRTVPEIRDGN